MLRFLSPVLFFALAFWGFPLQAEDLVVHITVDKSTSASYCILDNRIYSEGGIRQLSNGETLVCARAAGSNESNPRMAWQIRPTSKAAK